MISQPARILGHMRAAVVIGCVLCACSSQQHRTYQDSPRGKTKAAVSSTANTRLSVAERAAVVAVRQLGVPYRYGGNSTSGFDCSGLVHYAYASAGKSIPRTTRALWRDLRPVAADSLRVGDLVFFNIDGKISHVGMYIGDRRFVHAPSTGREVTIEELDSDFYRQAFIRGGRP